MSSKTRYYLLPLDSDRARVLFWRDNAIPACRRMKAGMTFESISEDGFGIAPVLRVLAGRDLNRGLDVAKSFKRDGPRAVAILAIASAILEKEVSTVTR